MGNLANSLKAAYEKAGRSLPDKSPTTIPPKTIKAQPVDVNKPTQRTPTKLKVDHAGIRASEPSELPRSCDRGRIDWWISITGHSSVRWAFIEPTGNSNGVIVFLANQNAGVIESFVEQDEISAKVRLSRMDFVRRDTKPFLRRKYHPPKGPWHKAATQSQATRPQPNENSDRVPSAQALATKSPRGPGHLKPNSHFSPPLVIVKTTGAPKCLLKISKDLNRPLRKLSLASGMLLQVPGRIKTDEHEVTIGLDFGTSFTKVVIGDTSLDKAFAVPFRNMRGVDAYLLPTRLFEKSISSQIGEEDYEYNLESGTTLHRDLKLGWLAAPDSETHKIRLVAFLALVMRYARGWLIRRHAPIYKDVRIVWRVVIGLPAETALSSGPAVSLSILSRCAWALSCEVSLVKRQRICAEIAKVGASDLDDPEIAVIPEIAAQIFGFVTSHRFDRKATNRYLLVDVGGGTVDSSLFWVHPQRGRKWNFEFFTAVVQPNGTSNLHVHRINWWTALLSGHPECAEVIEELREHRFFTDNEQSLPEEYLAYLDGVEVISPGTNLPDPDKDFLIKKLIAQVRSETLCRARTMQLLELEDLKEIPMFLCGGGARMGIYQQIAEDLVAKPGITWPTATLRTLEVPPDLEVETSIGQDYDRLSVAYGLGRMDTGRVRKALPVPKVLAEKPAPWTDRYIDKDQM